MTSNPTCWLRRDVYCTDVGDSIIFLDLLADKYTAVQNSPRLALHAVIANWPIEPKQCQDETLSTETRSALSALLVGGLLTTQQELAQSKVKRSITSDSYLGLADVLTSPMRIRNSLALRFVAAFLTARKLLHGKSIGRAIEHVKARAAERTQSYGIEPGTMEPEVLAHFFVLRPFVYTATNQCLLDSLVLYEFLHRASVHASLLIGVKTRPFQGHCWIQHRSVILNDTTEHAGSFSPIFVSE
jgi:hypothetical protein